MTERTKAILLFTLYLTKEADKECKPLSLTEWNKFVRWLQSKQLNPEDFLVKDVSSLLRDWNDQNISQSRLFSLLERKTALAIALDKWSRAGVWIISRGDVTYPAKLKEKLKSLAPNIIFGIGDQQLLQQSHVGVVGSRNADENNLNVAGKIGNDLSFQGIGVISGGAKGVDEAAMLGVLKKGGVCVGVLADSLIKKSTSLTFRNYILNKKLVLISPYNPEAGFNVGNAMGRNKLIYAMSELTIVVRSENKGGTWEGAKENLKNKWVPLWVCGSLEKGNQELVKLGGKWLPANNEIKISELRNSFQEKETTLFSATELVDKKVENIPQTGISPDSQLNMANNNNDVIKIRLIDLDFFHLFIVKWFNYFKDRPVGKNEIIDTFHLTTKQVDAWLEEALKEEAVVMQKKSNIYTWHLSRPVEIID